MFYAVIAISDCIVLRARMVKFRHAVGQRFEFRFHRSQVVKDRHALGEDTAAGEREAILRKISGRGAFGDGERPVVKRVHAGENLHQCGFAGAVSAD